MQKYTKENISSQLLIEKLELELLPIFNSVERIAYLNHKKVINAFKKAKVATEHFLPTTGYGHDDIGREKLDELFAYVFKTEAALVRVNFVSGTHAIACAILGNLNYQDEVLFALGCPYDTLQEMLDYLRQQMAVQVNYSEPENWFSLNSILVSLKNKLTSRTKMVCIQRSMGYSSHRMSVPVSWIHSMISEIKAFNPQIFCFVDNCYGEFVEEEEPSEADLLAGSLIKNPGGGIVLTGGYVVGKKQFVQNAANRLTCPGIGAEGGPNFNQGRLLFQGLYLAPLAVSQMAKSSILLSRVCEHLGVKSFPAWNEQRSDIIQRLDLGTKEKLIEFCKILQQNSPVNSHLTPIPSQTPGYEDEVIMAAGTFVEGATSELSADGPIREPYSAFIQGGLSYFYTKIFLESFLDSHLIAL
ncbi:MAG: methionine gamma-lyase family protein [Candidatus Caenarcaniphilales bacterium]|nr:methionine gamma-lyase family protein [Candidatus Caenarcaniphilales bacterium]